ncbi:MAG: LacI family DNA-binding transcriptional regulator [Phycisphaerae bacterium]
MPEANSVPTVKKVAAHCGVSEATVSRVLNGNYKNGFSVRKEVRQRITEVADALGYRPNLAAKNLVRRQTKMAAILGCDTVLGWPGNIYQTIINASVRALHIRGYDVCITVPNLEKSNTELPSWRVDGAIVMQECSRQTIEAMEKTGLAYVVINGPCGPSGSSVIPDDIDATRRAISHLMDLGHRRIAYAGPTSSHKEHRSIKDRHDTYLSCLTGHGLEPITGHDTVFRSAPAFLASAVLKHQATAILAYDHVEALKILHGAHMLDIQIPKQVSLICFNDEYLCDVVTPALTTIGVPLRQIGRIAAQTLLKQIESPEDYSPECIKLSQDLIIRASTAPPLKK